MTTIRANAAVAFPNLVVQMSGIVFVVGEHEVIPSPGAPYSDGHVLHIHQVAGLKPNERMPVLEHHPSFDLQPRWGDPRVPAISSTGVAFVEPR